MDKPEMLATARRLLMLVGMEDGGGHDLAEARRVEAAQLLEALAALCAPEPPKTWQPIETAPRDGSWMLAHRVNGTNAWSMPECIQWHQRVTGGYWQTMEFGWPGSSQEGAGPTHWMPLPEPPKEPTS